MWLVLQSDPNSYIYNGVKESISQKEFENSIENNTILDKLKLINTKEFDFLYIPAGTIHAIGQGNLIVEVQQSSNCTYRIYDYDRVDTDGKKRELHLDKALEVSNLKPINYYQKIDENKELDVLLENKHFNVVINRIDGKTVFITTEESFVSLVVLEGSGKVSSLNQSFELIKGNSVFVHANYK